jgi:hypothetical protein
MYTPCTFLIKSDIQGGRIAGAYDFVKLLERQRYENDDDSSDCGSFGCHL